MSMMKRLLTILCIPAVLLLGSTEGWSAKAFQSEWSINLAANGDVQATSSLFSDKEDQMASLMIDYGVRRYCKPGLGLLLRRGRVLGDFVGKDKPNASSKMIVKIGGRSWSFSPYTVLYSNGLELMTPLPRSLIEAFKNGSYAQFELMDNDGPLDSFPFDLLNARKTIESASARCNSKLADK